VELAVSVVLGDVDPGEHRVGAGLAERPVEAHQVAVSVERARAAHDEAGELGLHSGDHRVVGVETVGLEQGIAVPEVGAEGRLDELAPLRRVGLVPGRHVGVDDRGVEGGLGRGGGGGVCHDHHDERRSAVWR
jgi:hypothetical protein